MKIIKFVNSVSKRITHKPSAVLERLEKLRKRPPPLALPPSPHVGNSLALPVADVEDSATDGKRVGTDEAAPENEPKALPRDDYAHPSIVNDGAIEEGSSTEPIPVEPKDETARPIYEGDERLESVTEEDCDVHAPTASPVAQAGQDPSASTVQDASPASVSPSPTTTRPPRRRALLIGIQNYSDDNTRPLSPAPTNATFQLGEGRGLQATQRQGTQSEGKRIKREGTMSVGSISMKSANRESFNLARLGRLGSVAMGTQGLQTDADVKDIIAAMEQEVGRTRSVRRGRKLAPEERDAARAAWELQLGFDGASLSDLDLDLVPTEPSTPENPPRDLHEHTSHSSLPSSSSSLRAPSPPPKSHSTAPAVTRPPPAPPIPPKPTTAPSNTKITTSISRPPPPARAGAITPAGALSYATALSGRPPPEFTNANFPPLGGAGGVPRTNTSSSVASSKSLLFANKKTAGDTLKKPTASGSSRKKLKKNSTAKKALSPISEGPLGLPEADEHDPIATAAAVEAPPTNTVHAVGNGQTQTELAQRGSLLLAPALPADSGALNLSEMRTPEGQTISTSIEPSLSHAPTTPSISLSHTSAKAATAAVSRSLSKAGLKATESLREITAASGRAIRRGLGLGAKSSHALDSVDGAAEADDEGTGAALMVMKPQGKGPPPLEGEPTLPDINQATDSAWTSSGTSVSGNVSTTASAPTKKLKKKKKLKERSGKVRDGAGACDSEAERRRLKEQEEGTDALRGCHNDVLQMRKVLMELYQYKKEDIVTMMDNGHRKSVLPTKDKIIKCIKEMVDDPQPGDSYFFFFAGHSTQLPTDSEQEEDGLDEYIVTWDNEIIQDDDLKALLVCPLPIGASLWAVFDSCHSASLLDLEHFRCNRAYVPWINRGKRNSAAKTQWHFLVRRVAAPLSPLLLPLSPGYRKNRKNRRERGGTIMDHDAQHRYPSVPPVPTTAGLRGFHLPPPYLPEPEVPPVPRVDQVQSPNRSQSQSHHSHAHTHAHTHHHHHHQGIGQAAREQNASGEVYAVPAQPLGEALVTVAQKHAYAQEQIQHFSALQARSQYRQSSIDEVMYSSSMAAAAATVLGGRGGDSEADSCAAAGGAAVPAVADPSMRGMTPRLVADGKENVAPPVTPWNPRRRPTRRENILPPIQTGSLTATTARASPVGIAPQRPPPLVLPPPSPPIAGEHPDGNVAPERKATGNTITSIKTETDISHHTDDSGVYWLSSVSWSEEVSSEVSVLTDLGPAAAGEGKASLSQAECHVVEAASEIISQGTRVTRLSSASSRSAGIVRKQQGPFSYMVSSPTVSHADADERRGRSVVIVPGVAGAPVDTSLMLDGRMMRRCHAKVPRCMSPTPMYCQGWCEKASPEQVRTKGPFVMSLSAAKDGQTSWEDRNGSSMTQSLVKALRKDPHPTLDSLLKHVSHDLHAVSVEVHTRSREYKRQARRVNMRRVKQGKPERETKKVEMDNFQDPQVSSLFPLDMKREVWAP